MKLENVESKELLTKDFFMWLFEDDRIIDKSVVLESEVDLSLAHTYKDPNIYFPKQIANLLETKAFKRLGRISQLDLAIDIFPNVYHSRLEHSKGVYNRKLEEMIYNFQDSSWRKYIEYNNFKIYLLADLIKMLGHDIGHLPLSHAMERELFSVKGAHEVLGKRIMLEDSEIHDVLMNISPDLPTVLKEVCEEDILNFKQHDESSYDVDRIDYVTRDTLYAGNPVYIHHEKYINQSSSDLNVDVYPYYSLHEIENLLESREKGYTEIYSSPEVQVREGILAPFFKVIQSSNSKSTINLKQYITRYKDCEIENVDLAEILKWDDIKYYSEVLDIAENHEDSNVRALAVMALPKMNEFLNMIYSHLQIYTKGKVYSKEDAEFLRKLKHFIVSNDEVSQNLKNPNFAKENTLVYISENSLPAEYNSLLEKGLIASSKCYCRAYNVNEPIFIRGKDDKVYELSQHPDRKYDWDKRFSCWHTEFAFVPFLKYNGVSDEQINAMKKVFNYTSPSKLKNNSKTSVNMRPLSVEKNIEDVFLEI